MSTKTKQQSQSPKVCLLPKKPKEKIKKANPVKKLVQKYDPKPITNAHVRFDTRENSWALLDPHSLNPIQHFDMALMKNVSFKTHRTSDWPTCIANTDYIGIAVGDIYLHRGSDKIKDADNLYFKGQSGFFNAQDKQVSTASQVLLMNNRHSLYWK